MIVRHMVSLATVVLLVPAVARAQCTAIATPVGFGTYLPFSPTPTDSTGSVTVTCNRFVGSFTIALNAGANDGGSFARRRMRSNGTSFLHYQLYTKATRTIVWGDGTGGSSTVGAFCFVRCSTSATIFGRIPPRQAVRPGTYADTTLVTITF
jgi:spore coat protein U-like protein